MHLLPSCCRLEILNTLKKGPCVFILHWAPQMMALLLTFSTYNLFLETCYIKGFQDNYKFIFFLSLVLGPLF